MAHACVLFGDLGRGEAARQYGTAALLLAQEAEADEAIAWSVRSNRSMDGWLRGGGRVRAARLRGQRADANRSGTRLPKGERDRAVGDVPPSP